MGTTPAIKIPKTISGRSSKLNTPIIIGKPIKKKNNKNPVAPIPLLDVTSEETPRNEVDESDEVESDPDETGWIKTEETGTPTCGRVSNVELVGLDGLLGLDGFLVAEEGLIDNDVVVGLLVVLSASSVTMTGVVVVVGGHGRLLDVP